MATSALIKADSGRDQALNDNKSLIPAEVKWLTLYQKGSAFARSDGCS